ncbi:hypothetical protein ACWGI9_41640 [Streptomyces sp. NPDC054833]
MTTSALAGTPSIDSADRAAGLHLKLVGRLFRALRTSRGGLWP